MIKVLKKIKYIFIFVVVAAFLLSPLFIKIKVECKVQTGDCPADLLSQLKKLNNKNLIFAERDAIKILKNNYLVKEHSMQLKLPNTLLINLVIKKPQYALLNKSTGKYALIDKSGTVLTFADNSNYPTIIKTDFDKDLGQKLLDTDMFAFKIMQGVYDMYQIGIGTIQNDTLVVDLVGGIRVIFPLSGIEPDVLLGSLRLIYTKMTTEYAGKYSQIDLRYKNPILR